MFSDLVFEQKNQDGRAEIRIINNRELIYSVKSLLRKQQYSIDLDILNSKPVVFRNVPRRPLIWTVIFGGLSLLFVGAPLFNSGEAKDLIPLYSFATIFALIAISCLTSVLKNYRDVYIFRNRHNGENALVIARGNPSVEEVEKFVAELANRIDSIRYDGNLSIQDKSEIYKKHLEFLLNEGVISREAFERGLNVIDEKIKKAPVLKLL